MGLTPAKLEGVLAMRFRLIGIVTFAMSLTGAAQEMPSVDPSVGLPMRGQPAADVLASED